MNIEDISALKKEELLKLAIGQQEEINTLQGAVTTQQEEINTLQGAVTTQEETIEKLNSIIANAKHTAVEVTKKPEVNLIPAEPFDNEGKTLQWLRGSFILPGNPERITAARAQADPEIINKILLMEGQEILKELA